MTVPAALSALGIGKTKLYELMARGDLESIRIGRRRLILGQSIEALVEGLRRNRELDARRSSAG